MTEERDMIERNVAKREYKEKNVPKKKEQDERWIRGGLFKQVRWIGQVPCHVSAIFMLRQEVALSCCCQSQVESLWTNFLSVHLLSQIHRSVVNGMASNTISLLDQH